MIGCLFLWSPGAPVSTPTPPDKAPVSRPRTVKRQAPPVQPRLRDSWPETASAPRVDTQWEALAKTCRYWTQQAMGAGASSSDRAFLQAACNRQQAYAAEHDIAWSAPRISAAPVQHATATRSTVQVIVDECDRYRYGSVDFRKCRATEKHRLENQCSWLTNEWDHARGERRMHLDDARSAWCMAARRYQIVRYQIVK